MGFVCVVAPLLKCMFSAVRNLALIQALQPHHQGEHGEQRETVISLGHGHFVLCLFGTSHSLWLRLGVFMKCREQTFHGTVCGSACECMDMREGSKALCVYSASHSRIEGRILPFVLIWRPTQKFSNLQ